MTNLLFISCMFGAKYFSFYMASNYPAKLSVLCLSSSCAFTSILNLGMFWVYPEYTLQSPLLICPLYTSLAERSNLYLPYTLPHNINTRVGVTNGHFYKKYIYFGKVITFPFLKQLIYIFTTFIHIKTTFKLVKKYMLKTTMNKSTFPCKNIQLCK